MQKIQIRYRTAIERILENEEKLDSCHLRDMNEEKCIDFNKTGKKDEWCAKRYKTVALQTLFFKY